MDEQAEQASQDYEVFRRAILHRDEDAWTTIHTRYRTLLIAWTSRCAAQMYTHEGAADLADQAFARAWFALTPERFAAFPTLAKLLSYLHVCVTTTVIDYARAQASGERLRQALPGRGAPTPEQVVLASFDRAALWQMAIELAETPAERVVLIESFVNGEPPRAILMRHPQLFVDITAVYNAKRNLFTRLRHSDDLHGLYDVFMAA
jgi:DNA-directed RNA polymerase specialized sigma24 family protein